MMNSRKWVRFMKKEKRFFIGCLVVLVAFLGMATYVFFSSVSEYGESSVLVKTDCENLESVGIINTEDCRVWASQKRSDFNFYQLYDSVEDKISYIAIAFPITIILLSLYMPCKYLREKKEKREDVEALKLKKETYSYAYIPVVILPLVFSFIFLLCGLYSNSFEVLAETWKGNVLTYVLMYYTMFMIATVLFSIVVIHISLLCVHKVHNYLGACILSLIVFMIIELAAKATSLSLMDFFTIATVKEAFKYFFLPLIICIGSYLVLRVYDKKKIACL